MKFGATRGKTIILGLLFLALVGSIIYNMTSSDTPPAASAAATTTRPAPAVAPTAAPVGRNIPSELSPEPPAAASRERSTQRPEVRRLDLNLKDKHADPTTVDPTLRRDLLAKVQQVNLAGGERNLFQFGAAPPPPKPDIKIPVPVAPVVTTEAPADVKPPDPPKPPPTPIPLKFYGYASNQPPGARRAFFLQGEDIVLAKEGDVIQHRYRVLKISITNCVVEDLQDKHQQTLPLEEQAG